MDLTPGQRGSVEPPPRDASFAAKMDYYRSQHTTKGVRATHIVGIPGVAFSMPVMLAGPKVGVPMFLASWALQVAGHMVFEKNSPVTLKANPLWAVRADLRMVTTMWRGGNDELGRLAREELERRADVDLQGIRVHLPADTAAASAS